MMKENFIDHLFKDLDGQFDIESPTENHKANFVQKLNLQNDSKNTNSSKKINLKWKPLLSIAASIIICLGLFFTLNHKPEAADLASISPELSETQDFFTVTIQSELKKINTERSPLTNNLIENALKDIDLLEKEYEQLKLNLTDNGKDQRVIYAMINNFQSRIDILNAVLKQIEHIKNLNTTNYES